MDLKNFLIGKNIDSSIKGGNRIIQNEAKVTTEDKVWVDSVEEVCDNEAYKAQSTPYAGEVGGFLLRNVKDGKAFIMRKTGKIDNIDVVFRYIGIRPIIKVDINALENEQTKSGQTLYRIKKTGGTMHVLLGEYPQSKIDAREPLYEELNQRLLSKKISKTGKKYVHYTCVRGKPKNVYMTYDEEFQLRNGKYAFQSWSEQDSFHIGGTWYKVEPIEWEIINYEECFKAFNNGEPLPPLELRSLFVLKSGIPYKLSKNNKYGANWVNSTLRGYLNSVDVKMINVNGQDIELGTDAFGNIGFIDEAFNNCGLKYNKTSSSQQKTITQNATNQAKSNNADENAKIPISADEFSKSINELLNEEEVQSEKQTGKRPTRLQKLNPNKESGNKREFTDSEIIKSWIDNGESVLLRGPSGIGKTERIKEMYPNLIYVKLTNNMFPEKVVGSINLQTGEQIPPDYAKQAIMQNATKEEKKLIEQNVQNLYKVADEIYERSKNSSEKTVILLDELLNVKPAVQSLVYTLVLNKLVESGSGLKLPANTVVVATGNQRKYSNVAEDLAEPLEKRFDHILDMKPKVNEWIFEYAIPRKVHPVVISYILSKYFQNMRKNDLQSIQYFYEEPEIGERHLDEFGSKGKTNDPRGWVSLSNALYNFENDVKSGKLAGVNLEKILRTYLSSKLRDEWAKDFYEYYNNPTLSVEEVVNESYANEDLPKKINAKFATVASLLGAENSQVKKCRNFIKQHCGAEFAKLYDLYWAGNDDNKKMLILDLAMEDKIAKEQKEMVQKQTQEMQY